MLDGRAGAASDRLESMHLVLLAFKSSWMPRKECCMALKLIWRFVNQRITSNKSNIIDVYREQSQPEN